MPLAALPSKLHLEIADYVHLAPWIIHDLRATNRYFRALVPRLGLDELLELEAESSWAHDNNLLACGCGLRLKKATSLARKMLTGKGAKRWWDDGRRVDARGKRWCLECGFKALWLGIDVGAKDEHMSGDYQTEMNVNPGTPMDVDEPCSLPQRSLYSLGADILGFDNQRYIWCLSC
jgi:hypothetical protein